MFLTPWKVIVTMEIKGNDALTLRSYGKEKLVMGNNVKTVNVGKHSVRSHEFEDCLSKFAE